MVASFGSPPRLPVPEVAPRAAVPIQQSRPTRPAEPGPPTGERITRRFFELCENPRTRTRVMRMLRSSADSAVGGRLVVAMLSRGVFTPLLKSSRVDNAATKLELIAAQLAGIAVLRYVTRMEPVATMPTEDLIRFVAPSVQATLDARR